MKKNPAHDYAVDCFRIYKFVKKNLAALDEAKYKSLISDYKAVCRTFEALKRKRNGDLIIQAVKLVYCTENAHSFKRNEISNNVVDAAKTLYCTEMTIYRYLRTAREMFCRIRGLHFKDISAELLA